MKFGGLTQHQQINIVCCRNKDKTLMRSPGEGKFAIIQVTATLEKSHEILKKLTITLE